ncbi:MAG: PEP-CTERM sorting domain-containing protein [Planctomycetota bacterium]
MTFRIPVLLAALAITCPTLGQTPGGPGDNSPHVDIGVDASTGQLVFGYTDIEADTPIVIDNYLTTIPGGGGGFTNIPFTADQDIAFRSAGDEIAMDLGFSSFSDFGQSTPSIAAELVAFDPSFSAFAFPNVVNDPGESFVLNNPGQSLDFHPTYILGVNDPGFIGRIESTWRFVPLSSTSTFSASETFDLIWVVGGDFDDDSRLTNEDEILLQAAIDGGSTDAQFDLNRDMMVDNDDLVFWFEVLLEQPFALAGDYNGNGVVDAADYTVWADNFGSMVDLDADGNGDGVVDAADYTVWADNFGTGAALSQGLVAIPEPTTAGLLAGLSGLALTARRRQR